MSDKIRCPVCGSLPDRKVAKNGTVTYECRQPHPAATPAHTLQLMVFDRKK